MKINLLNRTGASWLLVLVLLVFSAACTRNDDNNESIPTITTGAITAITDVSAVGGGEIVSDGNAAIIAAGLCYSSQNTLPVITGDTTRTSSGIGSFKNSLCNLTSGTTYYVRAYAINNIGVGYGEIKTFTTVNGTPVVSNLKLEGDPKVGVRIKVSYSYADNENDREKGTTFQWYRATNAEGSDETKIDGATIFSYIIGESDVSKYIRVGVKPGAESGTTSGTEVRSLFIGPIIKEQETVTFNYNGQTVTYGVIISPVTARKWLDRNLGAPNTPSSVNDWMNYGDLFQWGREADGHQLVKRASSTAATTAVYGSQATTSSSDHPGHSLFITSLNDPWDWRSPANSQLWQGENGINNPCPAGWHIPTEAEWKAENLANKSPEEAFTQLRLTFGGLRQYNGDFAATTLRGSYWTSSLDLAESKFAKTFEIGAQNNNLFSSAVHAQAGSCRCIANR